VIAPTHAFRRAQQAGNANELHLLRQAFVAFATALGLIGVVVLVLDGTDGADPSSPDTSLVAAGVIGCGVLSLLVSRLLDRPLDCSDEGALVGGYKTRFFLQISFANTAALVGFVAFFLSGEAWMYPLGALFTAVGFVRLAPSKRNLERDQEALNQKGCGLSLTALLVRAGTGTNES